MTTPVFRFSFNRRPQLAQRYIFFGVMPIGIAAVPTFVLAQYMFLEDHEVSGYFIPAGTTASSADILPNNWVPTPNVDPLNTGAVQAYYAAGPRDQGLIRTQFQSTPVLKPITYWVQISPFVWVLTGLGSNQVTYPPVFARIGHPVGNIPQ